MYFFSLLGGERVNGCRTLPRNARCLVLPVGLCLAGLVVLTAIRPARAAVAISAINALSSNVSAYGASPDHSKIAAQNYVNGNNSTVRGAVYSGATLTNLPLAGNFTHGYGRDVNDAGVAVGALSTYSYLPGPDARGFVHAGGVTQLLPTLGESSFTHANGINNAGTIVGVSNLKPFRYALGDAALTELPVPTGGDGTGGAHDVGLQGDVIVGWMGVPGQLWQVERPVAWINDSPTLLDLPAGAVAGEATIAGPAGMIVGLARFRPQSTSVHRATLYVPGGEAVDLGTLGGVSASREPFDVNSHGWVVGSSGDNPISSSRAFIYHDGVMTDLNTLLPPNSG